MQRIAIFASGNGSNALRIMDHFQDHPSIEVALVASNRKGAPVVEKAQYAGVKTLCFDRDELYRSSKVLKKLTDERVNLIVLAGFLWLVPEDLLKAYPDRIINVHPALLPKFGGKGMYGMHVHRAVKEAGESETGITIHLVNEEYDRGRILFQAKCGVNAEDTAETIAEKVHQLEYAHYPKQIEEYLQSDLWKSARHV